MLIRAYGKKIPRLASGVRAAETAIVTGDVTLGSNESLCKCCYLRGDNGAIVRGDNCNVQDNCVLHEEVCLGKNVTLGHGAIIHGCTVGDNCLIGMGAILLTGSSVGCGSIIGAGTLVPEGMEIPPDSVAVGIPARVIRRLTQADRDMIRSSAETYLRTAREELPPAAAAQQGREGEPPTAIFPEVSPSSGK